MVRGDSKTLYGGTFPRRSHVFYHDKRDNRVILGPYLQFLFPLLNRGRRVNSPGSGTKFEISKTTVFLIYNEDRTGFKILLYIT